MCQSVEKHQFRLLVTFSLIFVADTKMIFGYNFVAPFNILYNNYFLISWETFLCMSQVDLEFSYINCCLMNCIDGFVVFFVYVTELFLVFVFSNLLWRSQTELFVCVVIYLVLYNFFELFLWSFELLVFSWFVFMYVVELICVFC